MNFWEYQAHTQIADGLQLSPFLAPFPVIRTMALTGTNGSADYTMSDLVRKNWQYHGKGKWDALQRVPISQAVAFVANMSKRGWFCIPHGLDDNAIREWCHIVLNGSSQRPIIEISNEVWNAGFEQHHYAEQRGGWVQWLADKARVVRSIIGNRADLVVSGQFWSVDRTTPLYAAVAGIADAVGLAPYYGRKFSTDKPDDLHAYCMNDIEWNVKPTLQKHKQLAERHNLRLFAYEGGLHAAGYSSDDGERERLTAQSLSYQHSMQCANADYALWSAWNEVAGGIWCPYALTGDIWGHLGQRGGGVFYKLPRYDGVVSAMKNASV